MGKDRGEPRVRARADQRGGDALQVELALQPQDEAPGGPAGPVSHRFGIAGLIASVVVIGAVIAIGIPQAVVRFAAELTRAALR
jgi:hypothetical protein